MHKNYQKISKSKARKLFEAGKEIYLHTSLLSWNNPWQNPMPINFDPEDEKIHKKLYDYDSLSDKAKKEFISQFDYSVNSFRWYNCDKERGMRVIFLVEALPTYFNLNLKK